MQPWHEQLGMHQQTTLLKTLKHNWRIGCCTHRPTHQASRSSNEDHNRSIGKAHRRNYWKQTNSSTSRIIGIQGSKSGNKGGSMGREEEGSDHLSPLQLSSSKSHPCSMLETSTGECSHTQARVEIHPQHLMGQGAFSNVRGARCK